MRQLSFEETKNIVSSYVRSFGQRGAARALNDQGYRSPEGYPLQQPQIARVLSGGCTCFLAPEEDQQQQEPPTTEKPIAAVPPKRKEEIESIIANEELLKKEIAETSQELHDELIAEEAAIKEMERSLPPLLPCAGDHTHKEHRHLERDVKVSGIFSFRSPLELDEDRSFFGIPLLKHPQPVTICKPYNPRRYGRNIISTRDLHVRQK